MAQTAVPDFDERLAAFGSSTSTQLRPGQQQVLATYAQHHLDIGDHRNQNLLNGAVRVPAGW